MILIIDLSQVLYAAIAVHANKKGFDLDEGFIRHLALNSIRANKMKFSEYDEVVIACDGRHSWRKDVFPYYKAHRKKAREESGMDWRLIFESTQRIIDELNEVFPYRVIQIDRAEADDVIATICHNSDKNIMIVSEDKDFIQLHNEKVRQWNPVKKTFLKHPNPSEYLYEHIIRGDGGDGIPNIRSDDNSFVIGQRQGRITEKMIHKWKNGDILTAYQERNFKRNEQLIDLTCIPDDIKNQIWNEYQAQSNKISKNLFQYFMKHKLKVLMESINDFK